MLTIHSLELTDWCQHRSRKIELHPGTNCIVGPNGRGKSNVLSAAYALVAGKPLSDKWEDSIYWESDETILRMEFSVSGQRGTVERKYRAPISEEVIDGETRLVRKGGRSSAEIKFGGRHIKGSDAVTSVIEELIGVPMGIIRSHVFVPQRELGSLLFQQAAARSADFLKLVPHVGKAENACTALLQELNRFPAIEVGLDIDLLRADIEKVQDHIRIGENELKVLAKQKAEAEKKKAAAEEVVRKHTAATEATKKRVEFVRQVDAARAQVKREAAQLATMRKEEAEAKKLIDGMRAEVVKARATLATLVQTRALAEARERLETRVSSVRDSLTLLKPPKPADPKAESEVATMANTLNELYAERHAIDTVLAPLERGDTVCPTCGSPFENPAKKIKELKARLAVIREEVTPLNANKVARERELTEAGRAQVKYDTTRAGLVKQLQDAEQELGETPEAQHPDETQVQELSSTVDAFDEVERTLVDRQEKMTPLAIRVTQVEARIKAIEEQIAGLDVTILACPPEAKVQEAEDIFQRVGKLEGDRQRLEGILEASRDSLETDTRRLKDAEDLLVRAAAVSEYRALLEDSRRILHRDNLPKEVFSTYLAQLNGLCNEFMVEFGNPFAVSIDKELNISCFFPTGYTCGALRLSGGQQCVLSVVFRFAINQMFASKLGIVVLDEPTEYMDKDNIENIGRLFERIHEVGTETGCQTLVVTHAEPIISAFDSVTRIE